MTDATDSTNLTGKLLIAAPGMADPRFGGAVVFVCAHSHDGAMGLIVNMPTPEIRLANLLDQLNIAHGPSSRDIAVQFGGPVETGRGFVLHGPDYLAEPGSLKVSDDFAMTASLEVLQLFAQGAGPARALLMLGYAGWGPGQLESELADNGWLVAEATPELVFDTDPAAKWAAALRSIGVDPVLLSSQGGRA